MTACVNKKSKRVAAVVTASLVGALSIGAPAVALAANGGIEMLAADWATDAKVSKATDGKGGSVSDPLKATFEAGSGKYLVPTQVANQHVTTDVDDDFKITYTPATVHQNGSDGYTDGKDEYKGLVDGWGYKSDALGISETKFNKSEGLSPELAAAYFSGKLTGSKGEKIIVEADSWTVSVSKGGKSVTAVFRIADAQAKTYTAFEVNPADKNDVSDTTFTYNGTALVTANDREKNAIQFVDQNGEVYKPSTVQIKTSAGKDQNAGIKTPGDYIVNFTDAAGDTHNVPVTVGKLDLSRAKLTIADKVATNYTGVDVLLESIKLGEVSISGMNTTTGDNAKISVTKVVDPSGAVVDFDTSLGSVKGYYTVTLKADDTSAVATGTATVKYALVEQNVKGPAVYYGKKAAANNVSIDLAAGESFDASKLSLSYTAGDLKTHTLDADQLEVSYFDKAGTTAIDADELKKAGEYTVKVKVKPFQDFYSSNKWVSSAEVSFKVIATGNQVYNNDVAFYFDGKISGNSANPTYDGTDQLDKLSAKVLDEDGKELVEGTDYTLEVTYKGKEVKEAVDADEDYAYTVTVKPITFTFENGQNEEFVLTIKKVQLNVLIPSTIDMKEAADSETGKIKDEKNNQFYVPYTGKAVSIPALKYEVEDTENKTFSYVALDSDLYSVVNVKYNNQVVKEAVKADKTNPYTVKIVLTDDASKNYELKDSEFQFNIVEYGYFTDVESAEWYSVPVQKAWEEGYINGISGTKLFAPKADITRADAICILFNMAGGDQKIKDEEFSYSENTGYVTGFNDVDGKAYYAKALAWAKASGVANGSNGNFRPYDKITREEFVSLLANFAKSKGDYKAVDADEVLGSATDYTAWAKDNVAWAKANGIMGNNGAALDGTGKITRAQVAAMAVNYQPENLTGYIRDNQGVMVPSK